MCYTLSPNFWFNAGTFIIWLQPKIALGDGTRIDKESPVDVIGLSSEVTAVSTGWRHTCALLNTGNVQCWGRNYYGQLGDGTNISKTIPVNVCYKK